MGAPNIGEHLCSIAGSCGFEQRISEPWRIAPLKVEGVAKHSSLMATARVQRAKAIVLDLANVEDRLIAMWQTPSHIGPRVSNDRRRRIEHPENRLSAALPLIDRERTGGGEKLAAGGEQALAERGVGDAECHRLDRGAVG